MIRPAFAATALLCAAAICAQEKSDAPGKAEDKSREKVASEADLKAERAALAGTWRLISAEADGTRTPDDAGKDFTLVITEAKFTITAGGKATASSYKLSPEKKPRGIELTVLDGTAKGSTKAGSYAVDGDELTLCFHKDPKNRPRELTGKKGSEQLLLLLKKEVK
jgi:uncharacterized protein (TIGR03067 family)